MKTKPSHYKKLNDKQIRILKITYKFRFITAPLLTTYLGLKSRHGVYTTLERLADQEYLRRLKDDTNPFSNKGTRYALASKSLKLLRDIPQAHESVLHARYRDPNVTEEFITHTINAFRVCLHIKGLYPERFTIYSKYEIYGYDYFPETLPDIYLQRDGDSEDLFITIFDSEPFFVIKKRITAYLEHYETGDWEGYVVGNYPILLFICFDKRAEVKLQRYIASVLDNEGIDELCIYTTSLSLVTDSKVIKQYIWTNALDSTEVVGLDKL